MLRCITYISCIFLLVTLNSVALAVTAEDLFNNHCATCHKTADVVRNSEAVILNALTPGTVRQHRFTLIAEEKSVLIQYLSVATNK